MRREGWVSVTPILKSLDVGNLRGGQGSSQGRHIPGIWGMSVLVLKSGLDSVPLPL